METLCGLCGVEGELECNVCIPGLLLFCLCIRNRLAGRRRVDGWNFNMKGNTALHSHSPPRHTIHISDPICIDCGPHGMDSYSIVPMLSLRVT